MLLLDVQLQLFFKPRIDKLFIVDRNPGIRIERELATVGRMAKFRREPLLECAERLLELVAKNKHPGQEMNILLGPRMVSYRCFDLPAHHVKVDWLHAVAL